jgi:hypothetical protein
VLNTARTWGSANQRRIDRAHREVVSSTRRQSVLSTRRAEALREPHARSSFGETWHSLKRAASDAWTLLACATPGDSKCTEKRIAEATEDMSSALTTTDALGPGGSALGAFGRIAGRGVARGAARASLALSDDVARTFKGGQYATRTLEKDLVLRRVYGGRSGPRGPYWSRTAYSSPGRAKQYLALPDTNTAERVVTIRVPAGSTIYEGKAARAFGRRGGGNQVYLPRVDPRWFVP